MTTQITVLGLGKIGMSIGLALANQKSSLLRLGNDRDLSLMRHAEKIGAFDKTDVNLHSSVENAGVVVLDLPVDEIEETLKIIAEDLRPGSVVVDTSPVKVAVAEIAARILGPERYFVTLTPSINPAYLEEISTGADAAHADLFKNSLMTITSTPGTHPGAIELATDLAGLLGGKAFFVDPLESDGLLAASHTLPALLAAALVHTATDQPGWVEGRKLAGQDFFLTTRPVEHLDESKQLGQSALMNRENVLRVIDTLVNSLEDLRDMIDRQDADALSEYLGQARDNRAQWIRQRTSANWDAGGPSAMQSVPSAGEMLGKLVGIRPKKDGDKRR